jgi:hypothetical protein
VVDEVAEKHIIPRAVGVGCGGKDEVPVRVDLPGRQTSFGVAELLAQRFDGFLRLGGGFLGIGSS